MKKEKFAEEPMIAAEQPRAGELTLQIYALKSEPGRIRNKIFYSGYPECSAEVSKPELDDGTGQINCQNWMQYPEDDIHRIYSTRTISDMLAIENERDELRETLGKEVERGLSLQRISEMSDAALKEADLEIEALKKRVQEAEEIAAAFQQKARELQEMLGRAKASGFAEYFGAKPERITVEFQK